MFTQHQYSLHTTPVHSFTRRHFTSTETATPTSTIHDNGLGGNKNGDQKHRIEQGITTTLSNTDAHTGTSPLDDAPPSSSSSSSSALSTHAETGECTSKYAGSNACINPDTEDDKLKGSTTERPEEHTEEEGRGRGQGQGGGVAEERDTDFSQHLFDSSYDALAYSQLRDRFQHERRQLREENRRKTQSSWTEAFESIQQKLPKSTRITVSALSLCTVPVTRLFACSARAA